MTIDAPDVFCPSCGKKFNYTMGHENLNTTASGSATAYIPNQEDDAKQDNLGRRIVYCPYCGAKFSIQNYL